MRVPALFSAVDTASVPQRPMRMETVEARYSAIGERLAESVPEVRPFIEEVVGGGFFFVVRLRLRLDLGLRLHRPNRSLTLVLPYSISLFISFSLPLPPRPRRPRRNLQLRRPPILAMNLRLIPIPLAIIHLALEPLLHARPHHARQRLRQTPYRRILVARVLVLRSVVVRVHVDERRGAVFLRVRPGERVRRHPAVF